MKMMRKVGDRGKSQTRLDIVYGSQPSNGWHVHSSSETQSSIKQVLALGRVGGMSQG